MCSEQHYFSYLGKHIDYQSLPVSFLSCISSDIFIVSCKGMYVTMCRPQSDTGTRPWHTVWRHKRHTAAHLSFLYVPFSLS